MTKKVNRNDPCPCGSGQKYKKCCGKPGMGRHTATVISGSSDSLAGRIFQVGESLTQMQKTSAMPEQISIGRVKHNEKSEKLENSSEKESPKEEKNSQFSQEND